MGASTPCSWRPIPAALAAGRAFHRVLQPGAFVCPPKQRPNQSSGSLDVFAAETRSSVAESRFSESPVLETGAFWNSPTLSPRVRSACDPQEYPQGRFRHHDGNRAGYGHMRSGRRKSRFAGPSPHEWRWNRTLQAERSSALPVLKTGCVTDSPTFSRSDSVRAFSTRTPPDGGDHYGPMTRVFRVRSGRSAGPNSGSTPRGDRWPCRF